MDVKTAFIHGDLSKEIYMKKTLGFLKNSSPVCRLKKYFKGLKQAPCAWYTNIDYLFRKYWLQTL